MGTEWKEYSYSPVLKGFMLILAWFSFAGLMMAFVHLMMYPQSMMLFSKEWRSFSISQQDWFLLGTSRGTAEWSLYGGITALVMLLGSIAYLVMTTGRTGPGKDLVLRPIDRLYTDVHTGLVMIAAVVIVFMLSRSGDPWNMVFWVMLFGLSFVSAMIGSSWILSLVRLGKAGQLFSHSLLGTCFSAIAGLLRLLVAGGRAWVNLLLLLGSYVGANGLLVLMLLASAREVNREYAPFFFILLVVFNLFAMIAAARWLVAFAEIRQRVLQLAAGDLRPVPPAKGRIPFLLNEMDMGLHTIGEVHRRTVEEAVRGERMKTDLITNVSHDLKTPLTSIVNYVDLLGKEELQNERAAGYVKVLEEKAARMKQLIEDLVEASKASSGNLAVHAEELDLHQLVQQACGEFENRFWLAALDVRLRSETGPVPILADGRHVWRVLENLLGNVCKYALGGTRVYVEVSRQEGLGVLMVKNVSAAPLDMPVSQLTERFVRGDSSRSTEGSGLGLSIASSLTALMGGRLHLEIDGDLFKATVTLPLVETKAAEPAAEPVDAVPAGTAATRKQEAARSNVRRIAERKRLPETAHQVLPVVREENAASEVRAVSEAYAVSEAHVVSEVHAVSEARTATDAHALSDAHPVSVSAMSIHK